MGQIVKIDINTTAIKYSLMNHFYRLRTILGAPLVKVKTWRAEKRKAFQLRQAHMWYQFLEDKFGEIPPNLAEVKWHRKWFLSSVWIVKTNLRGVSPIEVGYVKKLPFGKYVYSINEIGLVNYILGTRNVQLLPNSKRVMFYNNQIVELFRPDHIKLIQLNSTIIFRKGSEEYSITLTPYHSLLFYILEICDRYV